MERCEGVKDSRQERECADVTAGWDAVHKQAARAVTGRREEIERQIAHHTPHTASDRG